MAPSKVDEYILRNREKLKVDSDIVDLINEESQRLPESVQEKEGKEKEKKKVQLDTKERKIDIEAEMKKVKKEISEDGEKEKDVKVDSSDEERETVEQKQKHTPVGIRSKVKVDGYPPSTVIAQNARSISRKGDVRESKTWQALLIERLEEIWGDIQSLFSTK